MRRIGDTIMGNIDRSDYNKAWKESNHSKVLAAYERYIEFRGSSEALNPELRKKRLARNRETARIRKLKKESKI